MAEMNNSNTDNSYLDDVVVQKQLIDLSTSSEDQSSPANTTSGTSEYNDTSATNNDITSLVSPLKLQGLSLNDYNNADEDVNESLLSSNNVDVNGGLNNGHAEEQNHQVVEEVHHSQKKNDVEAVVPEDNNAQVEQQRDQVPEEKGDDVIPQLQHEPPVEQIQAQDLGQNYSAGVVEDDTTEVNVSARSIATDESSEDVQQQQQKAGDEAEDSQRVAGSEAEEHEPASPPITLLDLSSTQQPAEEPQNVAQVSNEEETVAATAVAPVVAETARSDATAESSDDAPATAERKNETAAGSSSGGAKAAADASKPAKTRACAIL